MFQVNGRYRSGKKHNHAYSQVVNYILKSKYSLWKESRKDDLLKVLILLIPQGGCALMLSTFIVHFDDNGCGEDGFMNKQIH